MAQSSRWRSALELLATAGMIVASTVLVYAVLFPRQSQTGAPTFQPPARPTPETRLPSNPVSLDGAAIQGHTSARVGVIEYSDFECPFCARFQQGIYPTIVKNYVETGKIRFVFRHLPLERKHASALKAAEASECGARQSRFWPMHDELFAQPMALDSESLVAKARRSGLDMRRFNECMKGQALDRVRSDIAEARSLLISGTPTFLFGTLEPSGLLKGTAPRVRPIAHREVLPRSSTSCSA